MHRTQKPPKPRPNVAVACSRSGFSLVVTVAMLVLLTVVALGLLSLSTISLKSSSIDSAQKRAQANARMGLQMAIDQLQLSLGPDQMISANAAILSDEVGHSGVANPHWMGAWHSWRAGDLDPIHLFTKRIDEFIALDRCVEGSQLTHLI